MTSEESYSVMSSYEIELSDTAVNILSKRADEQNTREEAYIESILEEFARRVNNHSEINIDDEVNETLRDLGYL